MIRDLVKDYVVISDDQETLPYRGTRTRIDILTDRGMLEYLRAESRLSQDYRNGQPIYDAYLINSGCNLQATWFLDDQQIITSHIHIMIPLDETTIGIKTRNGYYLIRLLPSSNR